MKFAAGLCVVLVIVCVERTGAHFNRFWTSYRPSHYISRYQFPQRRLYLTRERYNRYLYQPNYRRHWDRNLGTYRHRYASRLYNMLLYSPYKRRYDNAGLYMSGGYRTNYQKPKIIRPCAWNKVSSNKPVRLVLEKAIDTSQTNATLTLKAITKTGVRMCTICYYSGCFGARKVNVTFTLARVDGCHWESKCDCKPAENETEIKCNASGTVLYVTKEIVKFNVSCDRKEETISTQDEEDEEISGAEEGQEKETKDDDEVKVVEKEKEVNEMEEDADRESAVAAMESDGIDGSGKNDVEIVNIPNIPTDVNRAKSASLLQKELEMDGLLRF